MKGVLNLENSQVVSNKIPIVFINYNRPDKTEIVLNALSKCDGIEKCKVYAFSDAAPLDRPDNVEKVEEVRKILDSWKNKLDMEITHRSENFGCSKNVVYAVNQVFEKFEYCVYFEDDTVPEKDFLDFMLPLLERYKDTENVFSIEAT